MIIKKFEAVVERYADKIALKVGEHSLTYGELNCLVNRAARMILSNWGSSGSAAKVSNPPVAALLFEKGINMVKGVLSVLKAGMIYVPLDSAYPVKRLEYMVKDSGAGIIVTDFANRELAEKLAAAVGNVEVLDIEETDEEIPCGNPDPEKERLENEMAYILYTSGTTGNPKGVVQTRGNACFFADSYIKALSITDEDRITYLSSFSHDGALQDIFSAVLSGAALYPLDIKKALTESTVGRWLLEERISVYHSVSSVLRYVLNTLRSDERFPYLRLIVTGGESFRTRDAANARKYFPPGITTLAHMYGMTESSVNTMEFIDTRGEGEYEIITLGRPLEGVNLLLLNEVGEEVEELETGEIFIDSPYIAFGYWRDPEATAAAFISDPGSGRLYRTGDLGRMDYDGRIEFMGRKDQQVKIRGFRVELAEIESHLLAHEQVKGAVVAALENERGETYLCAYIVGVEPSPGDHEILFNTELREFLSRILPDYMIPSHFVILEKVPLTPNGKVDRRSLPEPEMESGRKYTAPRDELEKKLVGVWTKVLDRQEHESIGIDDNFFELGGHSLKTTALISTIHKELNVKIPFTQIFMTPTIRGLAEYVNRSARDKYLAVEPLEKKEYYSLSSAQKRLYFLQNVAPESTVYNMPFFLTLRKNIEVNNLESIIRQLIARHEALRTSFIMLENEPVQRIHNEVDFEIEYHDQELPTANCQPPTDFIRPFDLSRAPLLRSGLIKTPEGNHIWMVDMHHIIADGTSTVILQEDFSAFYWGDMLPELKIQYKDFSCWQNRKKEDGAIKKQQYYWQEQFLGEIPVLDLPFDFVRPRVQSFEGKRLFFDIGKKETDALKQAGLEEGATIYMVLLAICNIFLAKITSQEDIIIGTPIAGRRDPGLEKIIGMFVNTLVLRNYPVGDLSFKQFLKEVKTRTLGAFDNQDYQFEDLVEAIALERDVSRNPLFDVLFGLQGLEFGERVIESKALSQISASTFDLTIKSYEFENNIAKFDLTLLAFESHERLCFSCEYCTRLFKETTIKRFTDYFKTVITSVTENREIKLHEIDILPEREKQQLLFDFNDTEARYPGEKTVVDLFEEQVDKAAHRIALVYEDRQVDYRELNHRANRLAGVLLEKGVKPGTIVGIMLERSIEMITGILGILKAGGAYLPVDPDYPQERIEYIQKDSGAELLVTTNNLEVPDFPLLPAAGRRPQATSLAYVIYTSGSTGRPKGVMVEHRNVVNLVYGLYRNIYRQYPANLKVALVAPYVFDASVQQIFGVLLPGYTLCIVPGEVRIDGQALKEYYRTYGIDVSDGTPTHLRLMVEDDDGFSGLHLKHFIIGGEALPQILVEDFLKRSRYFGPKITNVYGPTECCVDSTWYEISTGNIPDIYTPTVPIGKPMPNEQIYIVNRQGQVQPIGIPGELWISGDGMGRGYLNQPELTAGKFDQDLWDFQDYQFCKLLQDISKKVPGRRRLYRTGDLARWLPDGNIEFLSRIDRQVKIRGFRIELEEIENQLKKYTYNYDDKKHELPGNEVTYCSRCVLSSHYPGIYFDSRGVCNICREYEEYKIYADNYFKTMEDFRLLVEKTRAAKRGEYDCLLLFSGGKDSSYVLYRLLEMGLKVLAFTFDNGYISDTAFENIKRVTTRTGGNVDSIVCRTPRIKEIFVESLIHEHTVCTGCFKALTAISTRIAVEKGINMVITGLSRGQIFDTKLQGLYSQGIVDTAEVEEKLVLFRKMYHYGGDTISRLLNTYTYRRDAGGGELREECAGIPIGTFGDEVFQDIHFVDFFRYDNTSVHEIKSYLKSKDIYWRQPGDTGFCSTNCIINDVGIYASLRAYGHHNYAAPLSWDCRLDRSTREEALAEIEFAPDVTKVNRILEEIGYFDRPIRDACVIDREDKTGNRYLCAYIVVGKTKTGTREETPDIRELREYLSRMLPDYMIPAYFVPLEEIPLTPSGKVDRKALPDPARLTAGGYIAPRNKVEERLVEIWSGILGIYRGNISIDSDFFRMGGHSLNATRLVAKINKEFNLKLPLIKVFELPRLEDFADYINRNLSETVNGGQAAAEIEVIEEKEYYDVSPSQKRIWVLSQQEEASLTFNMPSAYSLEGQLDINALKNVFEVLTARHESLRTVFITINGQPKQKIIPGVTAAFQIHSVDLPGEEPEPSRHMQVQQFIDSEFRTRFELSTGPLLRVKLLTLARNRYVFLFAMHHIISDAISMQVLYRELFLLYDSMKKEGGNPLKSLKIQYKDYTAWQNNRLKEEQLEKLKSYWFEQLSAPLPTLRLPIDHPRPQVLTFNGAEFTFTVAEPLTRQLKTTAEQHDATLFMVLLTVFKVLLSRYSGQNDIVVGTVVAGREHADLYDQIGFYLNTLALRTRFNPEDSFTVLLKKVRHVCLEAYDHQLYSFDRLVGQLGIRRDVSRNPIFDVMVDMINIDTGTAANANPVEESDLIIQPLGFDEIKSKYDLTVYIFEGNSTLSFKFEYNRDLFENTTILRMAKRLQALLENVVKNPYSGISDLKVEDVPVFSPIEPVSPKVETEAQLPASYHQERLWFIDRFEAGYLYPSSPVYHNIPLLLEIGGALNIELLEQSIKEVIRRHQALRIRLITRDNRPFQSIHPSVEFHLEVKDALGEPGDQLLETGLKLAVEETRRPFLPDQDQEPLIRGLLIQMEADRKFLLVITVHHIIADRYSLEILAREILLYYEAFTGNNSSPQLENLSFQYGDFSQWQRAFSDDQIESLLFYWRWKLRGKLQALELPTDRPRAPIHIYQSGWHPFAFAEALNDKINSFAGDNNRLVLLAAFKTLLYHYSGQEEIVVGTGMRNRIQPGTEGIIGPIANLVVLRSFLTEIITFNELLSQLNKTVAEAQKYQAMPFDRLVLELKPDVDMSRTALFDVLFQYEENPFQLPEVGNLKINVIETNLGWGKYDLNLLIQRNGDRFSGVLVYNRDYHNESTISRFIGHFMVLLEEILAEPHRQISQFSLLTEGEQRQLLVEWNRPQIDYPTDKTIHEIFQEQAAGRPDAIAVIGQGVGAQGTVPDPMDHVSLTYKELNEKSDRLAYMLRQKGVTSDIIVGMLMERSLEMIIAILGILKAGGAYLPIDPDYPQERIDFILKDSGAKILLTNLSEGHLIHHSSNQFIIHHSSNLAYIIYTSGTTGQPKGCMITHKNVISLLKNKIQPFDFNENDVWTMFHQYNFDFSVWEMYGALLYGGKLIVIPKMVTRDPGRYLEILKQEKVTVLNQTPSAFYQLSAAEVSQSDPGMIVRYVIFGGEALNPAKLKQWKAKYPDAKLINMFGITETTIHVTYKEIGDKEIEGGTGNIGGPVSTLTAYVVGRDFNLLPIGVPGELCVGGEGLARGYLNRPELTAEKFKRAVISHSSLVISSFKSTNDQCLMTNDKIYRSGDLVKLLENGDMEYLGRIDHQVQIRGFRIELGEIENQLSAHQAVKEAVVICIEDDRDAGEKTLCACIVSDRGLDAAELRDFLSRRLPGYMVPSLFKQVDHIPLTSNGKVDRKVLRSSGTRLGAGAEYVPPGTPTETRIAGIWREILKLDNDEVEIGIHDNFFDIGGTSMDVVRVNARIAEEFEKQIPIVTMYKYTTIRALSGFLDQGESEDHDMVPQEKRVDRIQKGRSDRNKMRDMRKRGRT